jgi:hypothetical protein
MELLKRAIKAETKLQHINQAAADLKEIKQLDELRQVLQELRNLTASIAKKTNSLRQYNVPVTALPDISSIKDLTKPLAQKFIETPKSTTIFEGTRWGKFNKKITLIIKNTNTSIEADWTKYFNTLFGGMNPEQRRTGLITIPENKDAINKYEKLYNEFIQHKNQIPDNKEVFKEIQNLVKHLSEVSFVDDAPEDVREFFEQTTYGASLEFLTEDVIIWLRDNNLLSSFVVRAKG